MENSEFSKAIALFNFLEKNFQLQNAIGSLSFGDVQKIVRFLMRFSQNDSFNQREIPNAFQK